MRTASAPLIALINGSNEFFIADLITITTVTNTVLRYTNADVEIVYASNTFLPFTFERGSTKLAIGTSVDSLELTIFGGVSNLVNGIPMPQFAQNGGFDGATVKLERAYLSSWQTAPVGALLMFSGDVSDTTPSRTEIMLTVKSDLELLNIQMPRNLYQAGCLHNVYNAGCGLVKAAWASNSSVNAISTTKQLNCALAQTGGYFDQGLLVFTSGANAGVSRTVRKYTTGVLNLALALPFTPAVGDTFTVYPGCDKTQSTCTAKFNNVIHFRGYPYIPVPESAQ